MSSEQELQEKYMEMKMMEEQMKQLQEQSQMLQAQIGESENTREALDSFESAEKGSSILMPISQGIFAKGTLGENDSFYVNVGAGTVVKKNLAETKALMDEQIKEMRDVHTKAMIRMQTAASKAQQIETELRELAQKVQNV